MRVAIVHNDFRLFWKARLRALAEELHKVDIELTVIQIAQSGTAYDFTQELDATLREMSWLCLLDRRERLDQIPSRDVAKRLNRCLQRLQPDVVVAGAIAFTAGAVSVRWCRCNRRPVIIMDDARQSDVPRAWWVNMVKRAIYRNVDAVIAPASSHVNSFVAWGITRDQIFVGLDVVDNNTLMRKAEEARKREPELRAQLKLPKRFFLGVGRQVHRKNWGGLVHAYALYCKQTQQSWDLVLVGDGPERASLEESVIKDRVDGVHFLPFKNANALIEVYALADCFVLPSFFGETWGLVVNEAAACGLPIIVSEQCGCADTLVRNEENGWTFSPDHVEALTSLLLRMSSTTAQERAEMGTRSSQLVAPWSPMFFAQQVCEAIAAVRQDTRGFSSVIDATLVHLWHGRYRPT